MSRRLIAALALGLIVMCSAGVAATAVVVLIDRDTIYIGTDSLRSTGETVCKVGREETTYFTWAGLVGYEETNFSLLTTIRLAIRSGRSLADQITALDKLMLPSLDSMARLAPDDPRLQARANASLVEVALTRFEDGRPRIAFRGYTLAEQRIFAASCPGAPGCAAIAETVYLGQRKAMLARAESGPNFYRQRTSHQAIRELIEVAIAAEPKSVGPPVNILQIGP